MLCWNHGYHESRRRFNLNFKIKPIWRITHLRDSPRHSIPVFQRFSFCLSSPIRVVGKKFRIYFYFGFLH
jgi:hypothetical protein